MINMESIFQEKKMRYKMRWIFILIASLLTLFLACIPSGKNTDNISSYKVAVILPHNTNVPISYMGYVGAKQIEKEFSIKTEWLVVIDESKFEDTLINFAEDGYTLIFGVGGQFIVPMSKVAEKYPNIKFVNMYSHSAGNNLNLATASFREEEAGYVVGYIASLLSKQGEVAYVYGKPYEHMLKKAKLFTVGVKKANTNNESLIFTTDSWTDATKGIEIGKEILKTKADVVVLDADTSGEAMLPMLVSNNTLIISVLADRNHLAKDSYITSCVQRIDMGILEMTDLYLKGHLQGKHYKYGFADGFQFLSEFGKMVDEESKEKINSLIKELNSGTLIIKVPNTNGGVYE